MLSFPGTTLGQLPGRIRAVLAARGLSLAEVARRSRSLFSGDRRFHIPPNLYHVLERRAFHPSVHQLFALSRLSNFRLVDWLAVFGLVLDDIARLEAVLPASRTTLIDSNVYDRESRVLSFEQTIPASAQTSLRPLREGVRLGARRGLAENRFGPGEKFLYAKIGCRDAFAFPDLLPGSIVRVRKSETAFVLAAAGRRGAFFLVEHAGGLVCSRLHFADRTRIVLCPTELPFAQVEFRLDRHARILGVVDFEFRATAYRHPAQVPRNLHRFWTPESLTALSETPSLTDYLHRARLRSGLTFRDAAAKSAGVARLLNDENFRLSAGSLSEYESKAELPRPAHKWFSLCIVYGVDAWQSLRAARLPLPEGGKDAMPDDLLGRATSRDQPAVENSSASPAVLAELPYAFGRAAAELFHMDHLSIRDLFAMGRQKPAFHPYLADAVVLVVDRRKKRIATLPHAPLWAQPLYLLVGRDGRFICASCLREGARIVMRPFSDGVDHPLRLRSPEEAEIVGRVVGILRRTLSDSL